MHAWARGQLCIFMNLPVFSYTGFMPWIFAANKDALSNAEKACGAQCPSFHLAGSSANFSAKYAENKNMRTAPQNTTQRARTCVFYSK